MGIDGTAGDVVKTLRQSFDTRTRLQDAGGSGAARIERRRRCRGRRDQPRRPYRDTPRRRVTRDVEPGELPRPHALADPVVEHSRVVGDLAVAVGVDVAEADILGARELHCPGKGLVAADDAVEVEVGDRLSGSNPRFRAGERSRSRPVRPRSEGRGAPSSRRYATAPRSERGVRSTSDTPGRPSRCSRRADPIGRTCSGSKGRRRCRRRRSSPRDSGTGCPTAGRARGRPNECCCTGSPSCRRDPSSRGRRGTGRRSSWTAPRPSTWPPPPVD